MSEKERERKRGMAVVDGSVIFMMDFLHILNAILVRVNGYVCVCYLSRRTHRFLLSSQVELLPLLEAHSEVLFCLSHKKSFFCFCDYFFLAFVLQQILDGTELSLL